MNIKSLILHEFQKYTYTEKDPVDKEIRHIVRKINKSPRIKTKFSCYSHNMHIYPYITFVLNDDGWHNFWTKVIPVMATQYELSILVFYEKSPMIGLYGEPTSRDDFWKTIKLLKDV